MDYCYSDGFFIYYLPKELDHYAADRIKRKSEEEFQNHDIKYLIFDFEKTRFMDSSGIGLITGRYRRVHDLGGKTYVINVNSNIDKLLYMSGIYRIVEKKNNKKEIINDLTGGDFYE